MSVIWQIINGIRTVIDFTIFLLDLNFWIVSTLLSLIIGLVSFVYNLPIMVTTVLLHWWNLVSLSVVMVIETFSCMAVVTVNQMVNVLKGFGGIFESIKVIGHLSSHLILRSKDFLQRGVTAAFLSGQSIFRQIGDTCAIILSLLAYFVNTIINIFLIGTQNLLSATVILWGTIVNPLQRIMEVVATLLSFLSTNVIATLILMWTPCQFAIDILACTSKVLVNVFLLNLYGLALTLLVIGISTVYFNPDFTRRIVNHVMRYLNTLPSFQRIRRDASRIYHVVLITAQAMAESEAWQSLSRRRWEANGQEMQRPDGRGDENMPAVANPQRVDNLAIQVAPNSAAQSRATQHAERDAEPGVSGAPKPSNSHPTEASDHNGQTSEKTDLWTLLKEQEERKKCVICQDQTKTVLLLPCRHLCLCRSCTNILMAQPMYQHNCPLCRHMILQTLDVYL
uniref:E3 ubiquitin-protein ligase RNF26 n=1 Tax=Latimeria chalumnae TaxID=7897 RepID=H3B9S3_LATCH